MILPKKTSLDILDKLLNKLSEFDLFPVIGAEIEFYLTQDNNNFNELWQAPTLIIDNIEVEKEKGKNQFEVKIDYGSDIKLQINKIIKLKQKIEKLAIKQGVVADFRSKPIVNQPGSALHYHIHLENSKKENLFIKKGDQERELLMHCIGGLCETMNENMIFFAPYSDAYLRFKDKHITTPSKVCWGGNNRSASIRIPLSEKENRRLEHRVACADADPLEVINAIFFGIIFGIEHNTPPPLKVYGNAFLDQYEYSRLTLNIEEAMDNFKNSKFAKFMADVSLQF